MDRPTIDHKLTNGHTATVVSYFTQGEFEQIQNVLLDGIEYDTTGKQTGTITPKRIREANDLALTLAVKKLIAPDGVVTENPTIQNIKDLPFDPAFPTGQLLDIVNTLSNISPKAPAPTSSSS